MFSQSPSISPTDQRKPSLGNHRKALAVLGADDYFALNSQPPPPSSSGSYQLSLNPMAHDPFSAGWSSSAKSGLSNSNSGSLVQDSSEQELSPISHAFRSGSEHTTGSDTQDFGYKDFRRESAASADSSNSKSSQNGHLRKRLQGLFGGEDNAHVESSDREDSDPNLQVSADLTRSRNDSTSSKHLSEYSRNRTVSPRPSRPRTPLPSSDVTPWMYQQFGVCSPLHQHSFL
jgi:adenylate cyclase